LDPEGLAAPFALWLTNARATPEVVAARLRYRWRGAVDARERASASLDAGDTMGAALAVRDGLGNVGTYLVERWGERDRSSARSGTLFERAAARQSEEGLAEQIMMLGGLSPADVARQMRIAPERVHARHRLSLLARRLVSEPVTPEQDARDVLGMFVSQELRYGKPPFEPWVGFETDPMLLTRQLEQYARLLNEARERWPPPDHELALERGE
jgi:hypothetical protein